MLTTKTIGIVGGVGPYAGLDLNEKIFRITKAGTDQDHLNVLLFSLSSQIEDRTDFLIGNIETNPANGIYKVLINLEASGAEVVGIPCNTSHAPEIWNVVKAKLQASKSKLDVLNMISETAKVIQNNNFGKKVGILGTNGTVRSDVYGKIYCDHDLKVIYPDEDVQMQTVHPAIYDPEFGIKAFSNPISTKAYYNLVQAIDHLIEKSAEVIVLGCTEIPLAIREKFQKEIPLIDATLVLAIALIQKAAPEKLNDSITAIYHKKD